MRKKDNIGTISITIFIIGLLTASVFSVAITPYQLFNNNNSAAVAYAQPASTENAITSSPAAQ
jgi:hypothetical protein